MPVHRRVETCEWCRVLVLVALLIIAWSVDAGADVVGHWSFDEPNGTAAVFDSSSYGNDGALTGTTLRVPGQFGNAISLDGNNQYAVIPDSPSVSITGALGIAGWVYTDDGFNVNTAVSKHYNGEFDLTFRTTVVAYYNGPLWNAGNNTSFPAVVSTGTWHHFALTRDAGKKVRFYLDGVPQGGTWTAADVPPDTTYGLFLGARPDASNDYKGLLDEIWVFDQNLSQQQVLGLMELNQFVPEPSTLVLIVFGCPFLALLAWRRRRRG